jgi:hypothetical protein
LKLGLALDGLLTDTDALSKKWAIRLGKDYQDDAFWASLEPYSDAGKALSVAVNHHDTYVFAERPKTSSLVTRAWIKNHLGVLLDRDHLVMQAIKRYDCRLLGIDVFIDSNPVALENLKVETVHPITTYHVDRTRGDSLLRVIEGLNEGIRNRD